MAIPIPFRDEYGIQQAQVELADATSWSLATTHLLNLNLFGGALDVTGDGFLNPGPALRQGIVLPSVQNVITPWLGYDAWIAIQQLIQGIGRDQPGTVVPNEIVNLFDVSGAQLPIGVEPETPIPPEPIPEPVPIPAPEPAPIPAPAPAPVEPPVQPPVPAVPLPPVGVILPPADVARSQLTQPTSAYTEYRRETLATELSLILNALSPLAEQALTDQFQLPDVEQSLINTVGGILLPLTSGLEQTTDLLSPAIGTILAPIDERLTLTQDALADVSRQVREHVVSTIGAIGSALSSPSDTISQTVTTSLETSTDALATVAAYLETIIAEQQLLAEQALANAMAELVSTDQAFVQWINDLVPNPETAIASVLDRLNSDAITRDETLPQRLAEGITTATVVPDDSDPLSSVRDFFGTFLSGCAGLEDYALTALLGATIGTALTTGGAGTLLMYTHLFQSVFVSGLLQYAVSALLQPAADTTTQEAYQRCPVKLPSLSQAATARRIGLIDDAAFDLIARRTGYNDVYARIQTASETQLISINEAINWSYRTSRSPDLARPLLREMGFRNDDIDKIVEISPLIPPVTDLIRFAVREVFSPNIRETFQLDEDFPEDVVSFAEQQGLSREWVRNYWAAHWELPSLTQGYDAWHRLTDERIDPTSDAITLPSGRVVYRRIGTDTIKLLQRAQDIGPFWRDPLLYISNRPLTRIDLRQGYVSGAFTEDDVVSGLIEQGYSVEDAYQLLGSFRAQKEKSQLTEVGEQRRAVAVAFASAYEKGVIDRSTYQFALTDLNYDPETARVAVERSTLERTLKLLSEAEGYVKRGYTKRNWTEEQTIAIMTEWGFAPSVIEERLRLWNLELLASEDETGIGKEKEATKAEILSFMTNGIITREQAMERIIALGYPVDEADLLVRNTEMKALGARMRRTIDSVRSSYVQGTLTLFDASGELDALGIPQQTRDDLLYQWEQERQLQQINSIRGQYVQSLIDRSIAEGELIILGVPQEQRDRMFELWDSEKERISRLMQQVVSSNGAAA